jgi:large subunit ribosomal protein L10
LIKGVLVAGPRPEKVAVVEEVREHLADAGAAILTEYRGLKVGDLATLRRQLRIAGADYKIFKNTLVRRATADTDRAVLDPLLDGPTAIVFVRDDVAAVAKVLRDFGRVHPQLVVKGGMIGSQLLDAGGASALADLPSREAQLAQLAGAIAAPMQQFAGLLLALPRNLAYGLSSLLEKRSQEEGPPEVAEAPLPAEPEPAADTEPTAQAEPELAAEADPPADTEPAAEAEAGAAAEPAAEAEPDPETTPSAEDEAGDEAEGDNPADTTEAAETTEVAETTEATETTEG